MAVFKQGSKLLYRLWYQYFSPRTGLLNVTSGGNNGRVFSTWFFAPFPQGRIGLKSRSINKTGMKHFENLYFFVSVHTLIRINVHTVLHGCETWSFTLTEASILTASENKVLRKSFWT